MPLSHNSKWFGVEDARIRVIDSDPESGVVTYGPRIDVPGIKSVGISGDVTSNELRGDNQRLDYNATLGGLSLSFEFAKQSLDVMSALVGGVVADTGTAPSQTTTYVLSAGDQFSYFEFEAMTRGVDFTGGDGHMILHKVILTGFPEIGFAEEDYRTYTVEGAGIPLLSDGRMLTITTNETATPIPA